MSELNADIIFKFKAFIVDGDIICPILKEEWTIKELDNVYIIKAIKK